jgi:methylglutaconyl-CoA hydratase
VTLDRPEVRNAFDDALIRELQKAFERVENDKAVRVVVLAGTDRRSAPALTSTGMKRMAGYDYEENLADAQALATMLATLDRMPKPTIARVHGPAFAGGTGLVAPATSRSARPRRNSAFPRPSSGFSPATISPYVIRAIGERMAQRYFLTAEVFDAAEALPHRHALGLGSCTGARFRDREPCKAPSCGRVPRHS